MQKNMKQKKTNEDDLDIIELILEDHRPLKGLIKILTNLEIDINERYSAFEEFVPLLAIHTKPEERSLYAEMKKDDQLIINAMEGDSEHSLINQLITEVKLIEDDYLWSAKVKILAEVLDHHIKEEEEVLSSFRKRSEKRDRIAVGKRFLQLKEELEVRDPLFNVMPRSKVKDPSYIHH